MSDVKFGPEFVVQHAEPGAIKTQGTCAGVSEPFREGWVEVLRLGFKLEPFKGLEAGPGTDSAKIVFGPATTVSNRRIHRPAHAHCRPERKPMA
jgi:hypothetical protein